MLALVALFGGIVAFGACVVLGTAVKFWLLQSVAIVEFGETLIVVLAVALLEPGPAVVVAFGMVGEGARVVKDAFVVEFGATVVKKVVAFCRVAAVVVATSLVD